MQKQIANLVYNSYLLNKKDYKKFILDVIEIYSNKYDISDYIKDIIFSNKTILVGSHYNSDKRKIVFDLKEEESYIFNQLIHFTKKVRSYGSEEFYRLILLLELVFHELDHALLEKELNENKNDKLINMCRLCDLEKDYGKNFFKYIKYQINDLYLTYLYGENHDMVPFERRANIQSLRNIKSVLEELKCSDLENDKLLESNRLVDNKLSSKEIDSYIFSHYISNSPSYDYLNLISSICNVQNLINLYNSNPLESFRIDSSLYNLDERVLYGLQISHDELKMLTKK